MAEYEVEPGPNPDDGVNYGFWGCGMCGRIFQVLVDNPNFGIEDEYTGEPDIRLYMIDEAATGDEFVAHLYDVHDKDQDGVLDE